MRLQKHLNEAFSQKDVDLLMKECKYFLQHTSNGQKLFRGSKRPAKSLVKIKTRKNRIPKDIPLILHQKLDEEFHRRFGIYARSECLFATSRYEMAEDYGIVNYIFLPGNNWKVIYSERIMDIWIELNKRNLLFGTHHQLNTDISSEEQDKIIKEIVSEYKITTNISKAMYSYSELMIKIPSYYMIDAKVAQKNMDDINFMSDREGYTIIHY